MAGQSALPGGGGAAEEVLVGGTAARLQITLQTGRKKLFYDLRYMKTKIQVATDSGVCCAFNSEFSLKPSTYSNQIRNLLKILTMESGKVLCGNFSLFLCESGLSAYSCLILFPLEI